MKKVFVLVAAVLCIGCSQHAEQLAEDVLLESTEFHMYTPEQEFYINEIYSCCIAIWGSEIPSDLSKVEAIRFCEVHFDPTGDIVSEIVGYEDIKDILWPNGFSYD